METIAIAIIGLGISIISFLLYLRVDSFIWELLGAVAAGITPYFAFAQLDKVLEWGDWFVFPSVIIWLSFMAYWVKNTKTVLFKRK